MIERRLHVRVLRRRLLAVFDPNRPDDGSVELMQDADVVRPPQCLHRQHTRRIAVNLAHDDVARLQVPVEERLAEPDCKVRCPVRDEGELLKLQEELAEGISRLCGQDERDREPCVRELLDAAAPEVEL